MKKRHYGLLVLCVASLVTMASCVGHVNSDTTSSTSSNSQTTITKTNADFQKASTTYNGNQLNVNTLYNNDEHPHINPHAEQHVLVVPFGFTNYTSKQTKENRDNIETTFIGNQSDMDKNNGWISVADYYYRSSFGKSTFNATVLPEWVVYPGTDEDYFDAAKGRGAGLYAAEWIRSWYLTEYAKDNHGSLGKDAEPLTYYDHDGDGYLDFVWIVYSRNQTKNDTKFWWAYVTYNDVPVPNKSAPTVNTLGWASLNFMQSNYGGFDAHTFVHETGHGYGLNDYYDYNKQWSPMGGIDMMDHNLGDHSAYSKFTLGWLSPLVVDDSAIITLKPTTTSGDCFIIPSPNYNGTAFDEYMMIEFMAPIGLAQKDYTNGYDSVSGYSDYGVRISHIDARVVEKQSSEKEGYLTNIKDIYEKGKTIRITNSKGGRSNNVASSNFFPVEDSNGKVTAWNPYAESMIFESTFDPTDNITTSSTNSASNNSLFKKGARFSLEEGRTWVNYMPSRSNLWNKAKTMTSGTMPDKQKYTIDKDCKFNYRIRINDINVDSTNPENSTATITVEKIK